MQRIEIQKTDSGQRFDKFLKRYFKNAGSGFLYKMLRKKNIVLNGAKATGREMLQTKDEVKVFFSEETFHAMKGDSIPDSRFEQLRRLPHPHVDVVYEDDYILVANKPANVLSQSEKAAEFSLNEELISYLIHKGEVTGDSFRLFHPSVSNRLDRNTTGLILFGKTLQGQQFLSEAIKDRSMKKIYHAVCLGRVDEPMILEGFLRKDSSHNRVWILDNQESELDRPIKTGISPILCNDRFSLLSVELFTGRPHQIRAHLSSIGHPILFDPKYGDPNRDRSFSDILPGNPAQLLHAFEVTLPDGRCFQAPEPDSFRVLREYADR